MSSVANSARKSTPCARSLRARSSSHGSRVRSYTWKTGTSALEPAELAPVVQRRPVEAGQHRAQALDHGVEHARVAGRVVVLRQHLVGEQDRPHVVALRDRVLGYGPYQPSARWCATMKST